MFERKPAEGSVANREAIKNEEQEVLCEFVSRETVERRRREADLIGLTWPTRLTIILVGTSILFSVFFGLEFLITKLVSNYLASARNHRAASLVEPVTQPSATTNHNTLFVYPPQKAAPRSGFCGSAMNCPIWLHLAQLGGDNRTSQGSTKTSSDGDELGSSHLRQRKRNIFGQPTSKLGVDFDLIYERCLAYTRGGRYARKSLRLGRQYEYGEEFEPGEAKSKHMLIQPELKLNQLLSAYHAAMPFDPDIWRHSEPVEQLHLLSGNLFECREQLSRLVDEIGLAIGSDACNHNSTRAQARPPPLQHVGSEHYKLMKLLDSFGRPEAGSLMGHPFWLGSYLECLKHSERWAEPGQSVPGAHQDEMATRYCVGKLAFKTWSRAAEGEADERLPKSSLKVGLCLPKQCDSLALFQARERGQFANETIEQIKQLALQLIKFNLNEQIYPSNQFGIDDIYCLPPDERRHLSLAAYLLLVVTFSWLLLMLICTYLRHHNNRTRNVIGPIRIDERLVEIMAIDVNLALFLRPNAGKSTREAAAVNLNVLDSVKHLGCVGVIMAHVFLAYLTLGTSYSHTIETLGRDMRTMLLLSLNNIVDTFFVISGLLVAYLSLKKLHGAKLKKIDEKRPHHEQSGKLFNKPTSLKRYTEIVAKRYLRMAPLYFLVYCFAKTMSVHLGEGPLWDYATNRESLRGLCRRESWWWPLMFASDFKPIAQHCVPPAWSIAVDMQFFLVLPLFVFGLASSRLFVRRVTSAIIAGLVILSTALTLHEYLSILDYVSLQDFAKLRLHVFTVLIKHADNAYSQPQNRMGPILVGLLGGHLLFQYEQNKTGRWRNGWLRGIWLKLALVCCILSTLAPCYVQLRERARCSMRTDNQTIVSRLMQLVLVPFDTSARFDCYLALGGFVLIKPLWSLCNCLVFMRLMSDLNHTFWARLMSLNFWQILSKLNYALLLIHFELIAYESMSRLSHHQPITWAYLLSKFAFAYLFSLLIAMPLYVLFEQPVHGLISWLVWREPLAKRENKQQAGLLANEDLRQQLRDMQASEATRRAN